MDKIKTRKRTRFTLTLPGLKDGLEYYLYNKSGEIDLIGWKKFSDKWEFYFRCNESGEHPINIGTGKIDGDISLIDISHQYMITCK